MALAIAPTPVRAQGPSVAAANNGQIERSRLPNPTLPLSAGAVGLGEPASGGDTTQEAIAPSASGDSDLGVQRLLKQNAPRVQPWTLFADGGFVNTTNVALTKRNTLNDTFAVAEIGLGYEHKLTDSLIFSAAVREQYFAYDRFDELDFGALNAGAGLSYNLPAKFWAKG